MQLTENVQFFPFETYIHSCDEKEYSKDVKRKNYLVKYISLLSIDPRDNVCFSKLCMNMLFFRNNFSKDAFLEFFIGALKENEKELIGTVVFDMFIRSKKGEIGEHKDLLKYAVKIYKYVKYNNDTHMHWEEFKKEHEDMI